MNPDKERLQKENAVLREQFFNFVKEEHVSFIATWTAMTNWSVLLKATLSLDSTCLVLKP